MVVYAPGTGERDPNKWNMALQEHARQLSSLSTTVSGLTTGSPFAPQGRLTLAAATPVMTSSQSGKTTVYYTPYTGQFVPIYNGSAFVMTDTGGELSQATTDTTKSPAAVTTNSNYDVFVWSDSGTIRATRGPAWSSGTARGTGAGTTELQMLNGVLTNKYDITNGPVANKGTFVGTIRSNGSSQIDFIYGGSASGGTAAVLNVWNCYNRVLVGTVVGDSGASYTYTSATFRQARASSGNQINFLVGLQEDGMSATYANEIGTTAANASGFIAIGVDSTTTATGQRVGAFSSAGSLIPGVTTTISKFPSIGTHYIAALEQSDGTNANTFNRTSAGSLSLIWRM